MFFICLSLFRACVCTFPGEKPPAAELQSVLQRGQQQLLHWRSHSGGFGGLMLRRAGFCFWCYSQLILTMSKLFPPCTSSMPCSLGAWLQISSYIRCLCAISGRAMYFWRIESWGLQRNVFKIIRRGVGRKSQCQSLNHQCLSLSFVQSDLNSYKNLEF